MGHHMVAALTQCPQPCFQKNVSAVLVLSAVVCVGMKLR